MKNNLDKVSTITSIKKAFAGSGKMGAKVGGKPPVKVIALSGTEGVTKNMTIFECGNDIIAVDCGIGFPDDTMPGVDVVIPDFTYLLENKEKVRGIIISHGHEDHLGAVPYLLRELNVPIYANELVQGFIKGRLKDRGTKDMEKTTKFHLLQPDQPEINLGNFKLSAFKVNHSVPRSLGLSINTPQGRILHMADFKVDWTPVLDDPIDLATIAKFGKEGVLCLLSDCLGSTTEGYSKSERTLDQTFHELFEKAGDRQIMVTTISSNISRMHQIISAAIHMDRKVVIAGRSIQQSIKVARGLKLLNFDDGVFISQKDAKQHHQKELVYIVAGCYGQHGSTLDRVSRDDHRDIAIQENAMVIFSADPNPPGADVAVERVMDNLTLKDAEIFYSQIQANLHVSGHGPKGDLTIVAATAKPKHFIPIGGTITKVRAYKNMMGDLGYDKNTVFELLEGESVIFENGLGKLGNKVETKQVLVDGGTPGKIGEVVIRDRVQLSSDGVFAVVIPKYASGQAKGGKAKYGKAEVITRGFVYVKESKELMNKTRALANKVIQQQNGKDDNWGALQNKIEREVGRFLYKETGRNPMIIVHSVFV